MKEKRHLVMWVEVIALAVLLARLETVRIRENAKEVQEYTCAGREQEGAQKGNGKREEKTVSDKVIGARNRRSEKKLEDTLEKNVTEKKKAALTFDDGPGKRTGELLAQLEKYNAHATFFMLGQNVSRYPDVVKKMKEIGCELGNHSYSHKNLAKASVAGITDEVGKTNTNIAQIAGEGATVMRPPYGAISDTLKATVGMPMILWNIDTLDWKTRNAQKTIETTMNNVDDGDIILLHDIHTESVDAALKLIPMLEKAGYQLVTVSELAAAKGVTLENGGRYTDF